MANVQVTDYSNINDIRTQSEFKTFSFSNYKKSEVKTQLLDCIHKNKLEDALYWCAELVCSGHTNDIWEICFHYFCKYIHLANPKLIVHLERRYQIFNNIITAKYYLKELDIRNFANVRNLFAEIICILSLSDKKTSIEPIKISRQDEYDMNRIANILKAENTQYAAPFFKSKDPKELFVALNELSYHLSFQKQNMRDACYWIEWVLDFDFMCRKQKEPSCCYSRNYPVESKYRTSSVWLIWDAIKNECENRESLILTTLVDACVQIYCVNYTTTSAKKKRYLFYYAVSLLTEHVNYNIEMISPSNKLMIESILSKINKVYLQIKNNEKSPKLEYLFDGMQSPNEYSNSIKQLEMLNEFMDA